MRRAATAQRVASTVLLGLLSACGRIAPPDEPAAEERAKSAAESPTPPPGGSPTELNAGEAIERRILPGEVHEYRLVLEPGDFIEFEVEQRGIDVQLSLLDPRRETVLVMDLPIADRGPESLIAVAEQRGDYLVHVTASKYEDPDGTYLATLVAWRAASDLDRRRAQAAQVFYQAEAAFWNRRYGEAIELYGRAAELWRGADDRFRAAMTLDRMGDAWHRLGDLVKATDLYEEAARIFSGLDQPQFAAVNANHLGEVYFKRGKLDKALDSHSAALALRRRTGDRRGEALSLNSLGLIHGVRGEAQRALDSFAATLPLLQDPENRRYRATALHDLATVYRRLGKHQEAAERFKAAERIYAELGDTLRQAYSLSQVGQLVFEAGEPERALRILGTSLELSRQREGAVPSQVATLRRIGSVLLQQGDTEGARQRYFEALDLLTGLEIPRSEAAVLSDLGELSRRLDSGEEALGYHQQALEIYRRVGDPVGQAAELMGSAVALRLLGRPAAARQPADKALEISESLRVKPLSEDLRLAYFTTAQRFFDFNIDLLMELHRAESGAGHDAAALQVSERARARLLLDLLSEAGAEIRGDAAPALLEEERELQYRLNESVAVMESDAQSERRRATATADVRQTVARLDAIRAAIRRESPRYAALTQQPPLTLAEIQRLLDTDSALLEFRLGEERSHLWLVTRQDLESFELPPKREIEDLARQSHLLLTQNRREGFGRTRALLCRLSRQLLQPAAGKLGSRRLAIVADGALEYVPFAVLPDPDSAVDCIDAEPLVAAHEIVHLPSASTLAVLRQEAEGRQPPPGTIAVLADPVFAFDDPRLGPEQVAAAPVEPPSEVLRGDSRAGGESFDRLPHSRSEAMKILNLVPSGGAYRALDFDASKETVLSGRLQGYRIVHFATHGRLNDDEPALSRIVLSQVDRQGRPLEGSLHAHEIYNLRLPADLVVLSGCETALGKEVRGEGLLGLARGFMYAGASRVVVSLWKVSDRGTAELMEAFYRGLLQRGLTPAQALREAQLEMRASWPQPFYWAGFVLQGDWR